MYNHALTIAYEAVSNDERVPSLEEALAGLLKRVADLLVASRDEQVEILLSEMPFDTYEIEK